MYKQGEINMKFVHFQMTEPKKIKCFLYMLQRRIVIQHFIIKQHVLP